MREWPHLAAGHDMHPSAGAAGAQPEVGKGAGGRHGQLQAQTWLCGRVNAPAAKALRPHSLHQICFPHRAGRQNSLLRHNRRTIHASAAGLLPFHNLDNEIAAQHVRTTKEP